VKRKEVNEENKIIDAASRSDGVVNLIVKKIYFSDDGTVKFAIQNGK
jgi:hypothetical protein